MKKLLLFVVAVMIATSLMAAISPTKLFRLTIINKTDDAVYMRLEGALFGQFYYLTVPAGDVSTFTLVGDVYARTTWACGGIRTRGQLEMSSNVRLTFTPCFQFRQRPLWLGDFNGNGIPDPGEIGKLPVYVNKIIIVDPWGAVVFTFGARIHGEPTQEKVVNFPYVRTGLALLLTPGDLWWYGCGLFYYQLRTYRTPIGCDFRYQY